MNIVTNGLLALMNPSTLLLIFGGVVIGIIFGAMPGLSATMAVTLFLPISFGMQPINAIALLLGLYIGGMSGGLISAILINIPGTPSSIATTFDGHPMAMKGEGGKALGSGIVYSFLGGMFSFVALLLIAPQISQIALQFSSVEYFAITMFSLTLVASMAGDSPVKGLISACIGMFLAMIGSSPIDGTQRFTIGIHDFDAGLDLVAVMIGFFAIPEILNAARSNQDEGEMQKIKVDKIRGFGFSIVEFVGQIPNLIRSALIGLGIGILPGIGGGTSNILSYLAAKNSSKHPERFGTGIIDGIVASETANNASVGGAMIPLLTLGIPGDPVTAMLLGGLIVHGITPGPMLIQSNGPLLYSVFFALIIANILMLVSEFFGIRGFVRILDIKKAYLFPPIVVLCAVGAFSSTNRVFNVFAMILCGILGYVMDRLKFPITPIILSFILCPLVEGNLRRGLMTTNGNFWGFFQSPIAAVFISIAILFLIYSAYKEMSKAKKAKKNESSLN